MGKAIFIAVNGGGRKGNAVDLVLHRLDCVLSVGSWDDTEVYGV